MKDAFCSLSGAKTFIDSNLVELRAIPGGNIASYLMGAAPTGVDPGLLPDVLHEAVHHWSLNTRVGVAISLARAELVEASMGDPTGSRMGRGYARYHTATEVLRPIVEGLACFAEFDAAPGPGNVRVVPLHWMAALARPRQMLGKDSVREGAPDGANDDLLIEETLFEMRGRESTVRRKDDLLAQPLDPRRRGGYLTGYLLVKGLQVKVATMSPLAWDNELWLSFIHAHFFDAVEVAHRLLVEVNDDLYASTVVGDLIMRRLLMLTDISLVVSKLTAYNEAFLASAPGPVDELFGNAPEEVVELRNLMEQHLNRLAADHAIPVVKDFRDITNQLLTNRDWICMASAAGFVTIQPDGRLEFADESGQPMMAVPASQVRNGASLKEYATEFNGRVPAALEFWVGPVREGAVLTLASQRGVHAHSNVWTSDEEAVTGFLDSVRSNASMVEMTAYLRQMIDGLIAKQPWFDELDALIAERVDPMLMEQARLAVELFGGAAPEMEALWEDGFFGVFENFDRLKAVSALGLLASVGADALERRGIALPEDVILRAYLDGVSHGLDLADVGLTRLLL